VVLTNNDFQLGFNFHLGGNIFRAGKPGRKETAQQIWRWIHVLLENYPNDFPKGNLEQKNRLERL
jgi:hypothetical protein